MKKIYIQPATISYNVAAEEMIAVSMNMVSTTAADKDYEGGGDAKVIDIIESEDEELW